MCRLFCALRIPASSHANGRGTTASEERQRRRTFPTSPNSRTQHANDKQKSRKARQSAPRPPNETSRVSQKSGGLFAISSLLFAKSRLLLTAPCGENPTGFDARGAMWAMSYIMQTWLSLLLAAGMFKLHFVRLHASHSLAKTLVAQTFSRRGHVQTSLPSAARLARLDENVQFCATKSENRDFSC